VWENGYAQAVIGATCVDAAAIDLKKSIGQTKSSVKFYTWVGEPYFRTLREYST
jgi:hypothetical protein